MQLFFKEKKKIETNIAPLIDIVFLLLIFFMLANEFIDYETIDMTSPSQSIMEDSTKKPIVIFLWEKGIIKINNDNFTHSQIKDYLKEQLINNNTKVIINTSDKTEINILIKLMDSIRISGIDNIALTTAKNWWAYFIKKNKN